MSFFTKSSRHKTLAGIAAAEQEAEKERESKEKNAAYKVYSYDSCDVCVLAKGLGYNFCFRHTPRIASKNHDGEGRPLTTEEITVLRDSGVAYFADSNEAKAPSRRSDKERGPSALAKSRLRGRTISPSPALYSRSSRASLGASLGSSSEWPSSHLNWSMTSQRSFAWSTSERGGDRSPQRPARSGGRQRLARDAFTKSTVDILGLHEAGAPALHAPDRSSSSHDGSLAISEALVSLERDYDSSEDANEEAETLSSNRSSRGPRAQLSFADMLPSAWVGSDRHESFTHSESSTEEEEEEVPDEVGKAPDAGWFVKRGIHELPSAAAMERWRMSQLNGIPEAAIHNQLQHDRYARLIRRAHQQREDDKVKRRAAALKQRKAARKKK